MIRTSKRSFFTGVETILILALIIVSVACVYIGSSYMPAYIFQIIILAYLIISGRASCAFKAARGLVLFAVLIVASTLFTQALSLSFNLDYLLRSIRIATVPIIGFCYAYYSNETERRRLYYILYIFIVCTLIFGFYQYISGVGLGMNSRVLSVYGHPIIYSNFLLVAFWLAFYLIKNRNVKILASVLTLVGLLISSSRSSWLALCVGVILLFVLQRKERSTIVRRRDVVWFFIIVLFLLAFFNSSLWNWMYSAILDRFTGTMNSVSATQRLGTIPYVFSKLFSDYGIFSAMFGHGTGASSILMKSSAITLSGFGTTDNQYLTLVYDYGLCSLAFVLLLIVNTIKMIRREKTFSELKMLAILILSAGLVMAYFYELLGWINISSIVMLFIGIYYGVQNSSDYDDMFIDSESTYL